MNPLEQTKFLESVHSKAPVEENFHILFKDCSIRGINFVDLYKDCMLESQTTVGGWKIFRRALRAFNLAKYYDYSLNLEGERVECGVLRGFSTLLTSKVHLAFDEHYTGKSLHLVDSFAGLSQPNEKDALGFREVLPGVRQPVYSHGKGHFATSLEHVQSVMKAFPDVNFHKGWIPEVLKTLPNVGWAFVHIDVDLYEPTYSCLEYFVPRLVSGGVIINDDFASPLFPGGGRGWVEYCKKNEMHYVVLDSGQSVYIKP